MEVGEEDGGRGKELSRELRRNSSDRPVSGMELRAEAETARSCPVEDPPLVELEPDGIL